MKACAGRLAGSTPRAYNPLIEKIQFSSDPSQHHSHVAVCRNSLSGSLDSDRGCHDPRCIAFQVDWIFPARAHAHLGYLGVLFRRRFRRVLWCVSLGAPIPSLL